MTSEFPCARCGAPIPIPEAARRDATMSLVCSACGQRYVRRTAGTAPNAGSGGAPTASATSPPRPPGPPTAPSAPAAPGSAPTTRGWTPPAVARAPTRPLADARAEELAAFRAGDFVGNRYRIVRFVARGGMGEVYEADDLELRGRVALKTVHADEAAEPGAIERFKREIQLARRVTHPNVCRIFDVGFHDRGDGGQPVVFLTMELLEGETLADRLRRTGRMTTAAALPVARQLAAALGAAHAAGVVHRDFKSDNVTLVPSHDGERAVVTDFGIARGGDERFAATLTTDSGVIGTPAYMAPEQIESGKVSAAADQYAFGIVLYEMVTGELPFRGETPLSTAVRRLTEAAPSPRSLVPDLDPRWEAVVLRCLERRPEDRFPDVAAALRALEGTGPVPVVPARGPAPAGERRRRALAAVLLVVLAAAAGWAVWRVRAIRARVEGPTPIAARRGVAVLGLRNLAGRAEAAWLSTALAEMLASELGQSRDLRVVPGETVARALIDLGLEGVDSPAGDERARLVRRLGADYLVVGGFTSLPEGGALRLDLRLEDARTGEARATLAETGSEAQLFELVGRTGGALREALDARSAGGERSGFPVSAEGARLYAQGLDALRRFDPQGARELLERAVAIEPASALARSALASTWSALGYRTRAEQEAARARDLAAALPAEERLIVEARFHEAARDWSRAAELWQQLWSAFPDSLEHGLRVAACRTQAGEPEQALAAALALRGLPPPDGEDPRIDLAEATAAGALADFRRQAEAAGRAAERATALGAKVLAAEALVTRAWALRNLGEFAPARAAGEQALALATAAADRGGAAAAEAALGGILLDQGELEAARTVYERSLVAARELGDRGGEARALNNLAVLARNRGELAAARETYEEVARICSETGDRVGGAVAANNLAAILADLGGFAEAAARAEEALAIWRDSGDRGGMAAALGNLGAVRRRQGDLAGAERAWSESLALRRETGQRPAEAAALTGLAWTQLERGDLATADARFGEAAGIARAVAAPSVLAGALAGRAEVAAARGDFAAADAALAEAQALRQGSGERAGVERVRLARARLDLERAPERAAAAAGELLALAPAAAPGRTPELEAGARVVLARAELARGRVAEARAALEPAQALASSLGLAAALDLRIVAARVRAAAGEVAAARPELARVQAEGAAAGLAGVALEAELALAELGEPAALAGIAGRARAAGFGALAGRAEAAARSAGGR